MKLLLPERKRPAPALEPQNEPEAPESENTEALRGDLSPLEKPPKVEEPGESTKANVTNGNSRGMADDTPLGPILTDAIASQSKVHLKAAPTAPPNLPAPPSPSPRPRPPVNLKALLVTGGVAAAGLAFAVFGAAGPGVNSGRSGSGQPAAGSAGAGGVQPSGILIE